MNKRYLLSAIAVIIMFAVLLFVEIKKPGTRNGTITGWNGKK